MATLFGAAGLVAALAAISDGPLGAVRLLGRRSHRLADVAVIAALALSPLVPGRTLTSGLVAVCVAVVLWRLSAVTRFRPRLRALPAVGGAGAEPGARPGAARALGRMAGRRSGSGNGSGGGGETGSGNGGGRAGATVARRARQAGIVVGVINRRRRAPR